MVNQIATQYLALNDTAKALDTYKDCWTSYPDFKQAWEARIAAAKLQEKANQLKDAQDTLAQGFDQTSSAEGKASILAYQADLLVKTHQPDLAVEKFILLLSQYGDQNAARDAYKGLSRQAALVKDWRKATNEIRDWLVGKISGDAPGKYGTSSLNLVGRSELRRLALNFFIQQDDANGAADWLQKVGYASDPVERQNVVRDEAWMDGQIAQHLLTLDVRNLPPNTLDDGIRTGLHGWDIAPATDEGMDGLKAATQLALRHPNKLAGSVKDTLKELEALRGGDYDDMVKPLLLRLYLAAGDKKSAQALQP